MLGVERYEQELGALSNLQKIASSTGLACQTGPLSATARPGSCFITAQQPRSLNEVQEFTGEGL